MKHNFMTKMVSALLAVVLSTAAFSVTAFASGGEESTESVAEQETAGDVSDLLSALAGSQVTVSVTEDGIQFSSGENDSGQTGTVTTGGGNLNVRTGAGMDYTAFTQLPNGTTVKVIGTDGDWLKVILPEKVGYVYSGYMTVSDGEAGSGGGSFSLDAKTLENLLGMLGGGLNDGAALTPDGNLSLIDDIGSPTASGKQFITVETKNGNVFYRRLLPVRLTVISRPCRKPSRCLPRPERPLPPMSATRPLKRSSSSCGVRLSRRYDGKSLQEIPLTM